MGALQGELILLFSYLHSFSVGSTLNRKNSLHKEQIPFFKSSHLYLLSPGKQAGVMKVVPLFKKKAERLGGVAYTL